MKISVEDNARYSDIVPLGEVEDGRMYRYDFKTGGKGSSRAIAYLIAATFDRTRVFVSIEDGTLYNGDRGELRLIERAEFCVGGGKR